MPFDLSPAQDVELEPFTREHFVAWLRGRDPAEQYDCNCIDDCLICRYGRYCGLPEGDRFFTRATLSFGKNDDSTERRELRHIAYGGIGTVGAALSRALSLQNTRGG